MRAIRLCFNQQGEGSDKARDLLTLRSLTILNKLTPTSSQIFSIADLGCSVGPNTFSSIEYHHRSLKIKCGFKPIEFQVMLNDKVATDFNTLFQNLPSEKEYMAAGVLGSFYGRLFPKDSIDFFHSAFALHWISKVPDGVKLKGNEGKITYSCGAGLQRPVF